MEAVRSERRWQRIKRDRKIGSETGKRSKQTELIEIFPFCGITGHMLVSFSPHNPGVRWVNLSHPRLLCSSLIVLYQSLQPRAGCSFPGRAGISMRSHGKWSCPVSWCAATFCLCCSLCPAEGQPRCFILHFAENTDPYTAILQPLFGGRGPVLEHCCPPEEGFKLFALCWWSQQDFQVISRRRRRRVLRDSRPFSPLPVIILRDIYASVGQGLVQPFHQQLDGRTRPPYGI